MMSAVGRKQTSCGTSPDVMKPSDTGYPPDRHALGTLVTIKRNSRLNTCLMELLAHLVNDNVIRAERSTPISNGISVGKLSPDSAKKSGQIM